MGLTVDTYAVEINGEQHTLYPFKWPQLKAMAHTLALVRASLPSVVNAKEADDGSVSLDIDFLTLYAVHGDEITQLMALALRKDASVFEEMTPGEGVAILNAIVSANSDEFEKKVKPLLAEMLAKVVAAKA